MKKQFTLIKYLLATACLGIVVSAHAATNIITHTYPSGPEMVLKIGNDLYTTLDPACRQFLNPVVVSVEKSDTPAITPIPGRRNPVQGQVSVTTGYIALLNHIAHAKAIDRIEPGYFKQYVADLSLGSADGKPPVPRHLETALYWRDDVMIEQTSLFNQMIGLTLALNLSHHYLAHGQKPAAHADGPRAPINTLLSEGDWEASLLCATLNSLDCALAPAGARTLFDLIDQMPHRPAWANYVVPSIVNIKMMNAELCQYEIAYFRGGLKTATPTPVLSSASVPNRAN